MCSSIEPINQSDLFESLSEFASLSLLTPTFIPPSGEKWKNSSFIFGRFYRLVTSSMVAGHCCPLLTVDLENNVGIKLFILVKLHKRLVVYGWRFVRVQQKLEWRSSVRYDEHVLQFSCLCVTSFGFHDNMWQEAESSEGWHFSDVCSHRALQQLFCSDSSEFPETFQPCVLQELCRRRSEGGTQTPADRHHSLQKPPQLLVTPRNLWVLGGWFMRGVEPPNTIRALFCSQLAEEKENTLSLRTEDTTSASQAESETFSWVQRSEVTRWSLQRNRLRAEMMMSQEKPWKPTMESIRKITNRFIYQVFLFLIRSGQ